MKAHELTHGLAHTLRVVCTPPADTQARLVKLDPVQLVFSEPAGMRFIRKGDLVMEIKGSDVRSAAELAKMALRNLPRLSWVVAVDDSNTDRPVATVETREFPAVHDLPEKVEIGVDEKLRDDIRRRLGRQVSLDEATDYLSEMVVVDAGDDGQYCVISISPSRELRDVAGFRIYGRGLAVDVAHIEDDRLRVVRVVQARSAVEPSETRPVHLARGLFAFVDASVAGQFRGIARTELDRIVTEADSYLQLWRDYNRIERENILARAKDFGWLSYTSVRRLPRGVALWRFLVGGTDDLSLKLQLLGDGEESDLEADEKVPQELTRGVDAEQDVEPGGGRRVFAGACVGWSLNEKYVDIQQPKAREDVEPPDSGFLFMSWSGDRIRLERREKALAAVTLAECPMPQLGLILENVRVPERRRKTEKALSSAARVALGGAPTDRQRDALAAALNTPDIALVQGPPGTGKTRVIAALQARLSETDDAGSAVTSRALLTSYQHDAVENVASATKVFGLPAIKIGSRRGDESPLDGFERWRRETAETVRSRLADYPETPESRRAEQVRALVYSYMRSPCAEQPLTSLLNEVSDLCSGALSPGTAQALAALASGAGHTLTDAGSMLGVEAALRAVRGLRTERGAFQDDGPSQAAKAVLRLERIDALDDKVRPTLTTAAEWSDDGPPPFLPELADVRERLLDRLQGGPAEVGPARVNEDVEQTLLRALDEVTSRASHSPRREGDVLYRFLDELELDPEGARDAVAEYTHVLAATCQQAVGYQMQQAKGGGDIIFDTVVVDEAARANPLDLLIPMAQAERRIVLVGDHRQLPHLLDHEVERRLDQDVAEATRSALRRSLFERLFTQLRAMEATDGIRRTVTLDQQFRMHPKLAEFVSGTFYAPYGERFGSHPSTQQWVHDLPGYEGKIAAWIDLPFERQAESKGMSKRRPVEATWIAGEVLRLMEARPDFSVGVISFYSAQTTELMRALRRHGIAEELDNGAYRIAERWRDTQDSSGHITERLRVGTVDAFQGKEFDVVLLSVTRSNIIAPDNEAARRKKYGHLMLENRLCVAMSRQKRLLVSVGDAAMFSQPEARQNVPGLSKFFELCKGGDGVVVHP